MSPQKLLELALLDASGVLEHAESVEFERAFDAASEELKAQVRREQARFADMTEILPDVSPRVELRQIVIDAVGDASGRQRDAIGKHILEHAASERSVSSHRRHGITMMWRISTFAFATAFAVVGVIAVQLNREFTDVSNSIARNESIDTLLSFGQQPGFLTAVLDDSYTKTSMASGPDGTEASVYTNTTSGSGYLAFRKLPTLKPGQSYVLVALGDDDQIEAELHRFTSAGETNVVGFAYEPEISGTFAIAVASADGLEIVMRTA